jgi:hypothetical protein
MTTTSFEKGLYDGAVHDIITQKRIHRLLSQVMDELSCSLFCVPKLLDDSEKYEMERFNDRENVYIGMLSQYDNYKEYLQEFLQIWRRMWYYGFALYDFTLWRQEDGTLVMIDFDHTGFRMTEGPRLFSFPKSFNEEYLFDYSCFPQNFLQRVLDCREPYTQKEYLQQLSQYPYRENVETRNPV